MPQPLTARVTPDGSTSFEATITNLTPSSLFLLASCDLRFRQSVAVELGSLTVYGEVAFVCHEPPGAVVVYRASVEDLHTLEDHMDDGFVVEGGVPWTSLADEEPTNPAGKALPSFDDDTPNAAVRMPPSSTTEVDSKIATVVVRPSSRAPTNDGGPRFGAADDRGDRVGVDEAPTVDGEAAPGVFAEARAGTVLDDASKLGRSPTPDREITDHAGSPPGDAED